MEDCIVWQGKIASNGYGEIYIKGRYIGAHRFVLANTLGRPIKDGMCVLHSCDNRSCVNPDHLREGTKKDNYYDAVARGRSSTKETNPTVYPRGIVHERHQPHPDEETMVEIRRRSLAGETRKQLMSDFGVSILRLKSILNGDASPNLGGPVKTNNLGRIKNLPRGQSHPKSKLREDQVKSIRQRYDAGETIPKLAREFGIAKSSTWSIVQRQSWKHILPK